MYKRVSVDTQECKLVEKIFEVKMVSRSVINSVLVLRIVTLAASAATVALLVTNTAKFDDGTKQRFQDAISYR